MSKTYDTNFLAGTYFRWLLLNYAAGDQFQPRPKVKPEQLCKILGLDPSTIKQQ